MWQAGLIHCDIQYEAPENEDDGQVQMSVNKPGWKYSYTYSGKKDRKEAYQCDNLCLWVQVYIYFFIFLHFPKLPK